MKIKFFIIIFTLCSITTLAEKNKDDDYKNTLSLGFRLGSSYSTMNFNPSVKQKRFRGTSEGLVLRYQTEKFAGITVEVNHTKKGWVEDLPGLNKYSRRFTTIEVPVMSTIIGNISSKSKIHFNIGPQLDFIISNKETQILYDVPPKPYYGLPFKNNVLYSLVIGASYELQTKIGFWGFDIRYNLALSDVFPNRASDIFVNSQCNSYNASVIYSIPWKSLKKKK